MLYEGITKCMQFNELHRDSQDGNDSFSEANLQHPESFSEILTNSRKMLQIFSYTESVAQTSVITSYSIHYTKLYDVCLRALKY